MTIANLRFVEAYRAAHPIQAHAMRLALEEAGLRVFIDNESLQGAIGDVPPGWSSAPRLMVEESQLAAAREIIRKTDHSERTESRLTPAEITVALSAATLGTAGVVVVPTANAPSDQIESTSCLACGAVMAEADTACPKCGWTYESAESADTQ